MWEKRVRSSRGKPVPANAGAWVRPSRPRCKASAHGVSKAKGVADLGKRPDLGVGGRVAKIRMPTAFHEDEVAGHELLDETVLAPADHLGRIIAGEIRLAGKLGNVERVRVG